MAPKFHFAILRARRHHSARLARYRAHRHRMAAHILATPLRRERASRRTHKYPRFIADKRAIIDIPNA